MLNAVIVIDDSEVDRYLARRILKKSEITKRVIEMPNAASALDLLSDRGAFESGCGPWPPPAVILLDINMPQMGGFAFLDELERRIQRGEIPGDSIVVTMHTSSNDLGDVERALGYRSVVDYLIKPLNVNALLRLEDLVAARSPRPARQPGPPA